MKLRIIFTIGIMLFLVSGLKGQGRFGKVTPQVSDFIKYGNIPVSLFRGSMSFEIPLYHYRDQDFDIPLGLIYNTEGFKPSKRSDLVGLDWNLLAGGCITREIYGTPDDSFPTNFETEDYGYYLVVKDGGYEKDKIWNFDPSLVRQMPGDRGMYYLKKNGYFADYQPDLFNFNFNGHKGYFLIDDDGVAKSANKSYKIDITSLKAQPTSSNYLDDESAIRITTPEGYIHEFGGCITKLEYTINFKDGSSPASPRPTILAWHLSKITAPNGRTAVFNYTYHTRYILTDQNNPLWQSSVSEMLVDDGSGHHVLIATATKKAVLESIDIGNTRIELKKSIENTLAGHDNKFHSHSYYNGPVYQLDSINIKYNNEDIFKYGMTYENQSKRRFLKTVTLPENTKYIFTYNHANYPSPYITNDLHIDFYGFWKTESERSYGLMSRVDYPPGGYSTFEYERHEYGREVEFYAPNMTKYLVTATNSTIDSVLVEGGGPKPHYPGMDPPLPHPLDPPGDYYTYSTKYTHHGVRIKEVSHYTAGNIKASGKQYLYTFSLDNDESSGILYQSPPVIGHHIGSGRKIVDGGSIWKQNYNIDEPVIGYSSVIELNADNSYSRYKFSNWIDNPDNNNDAKFKFINGQFPDSFTKSLLVVTGHSHVASRSHKRGLVREVENYTNNHELKQRESYNYLHLGKNPLFPWPYEPEVDDEPGIEDDDERDYVVTFLPMAGGGMVKKIYLDKYHPVVYRETITDGTRVIENRKYNSHDLLAQVDLVSGSGDTIRNNYYYPFDYNDPPYTLMKFQNHISPVIEAVRSSIKGQNMREIKRVRTDFVQKSFMFLPDRTRESCGGSSLQTVLDNDKYDAMGNILQQTDLSGIPTVYIWSADNRYLLAEIVNATHDSVNGLINANMHPSVPLTAIIDGLRAQLPHSLVTTYAYQPLVGMTSKSGPNGVTTYYEYDSHGRLQYVKDHQGRIIQQYKYNFKP